jgi:hypothetical protein
MSGGKGCPSVECPRCVGKELTPILTPGPTSAGQPDVRIDAEEETMIDEQQIQRFLDDGAFTMDTPISMDRITAAAEALDRLLPQQEGRNRSAATCNYDDPALIDLIQDPFFEQASCRLLDSKAVYFFQTAIITAFPQPGVEFGFDQHIDLQYTLSDLDASPRRVTSIFFLWLSDVALDQAPMMYRPGSHRPLAAHWQTRTELVGEIPRIIGIKLTDLPELDYAEPQPLLAKVGQASVLTTGMVHGASVHTGEIPRKALIITFHDADVTIGLPEVQEVAKRAYDATLREVLPPERRHIVRPL